MGPVRLSFWEALYGARECPEPVSQSICFICATWLSGEPSCKRVCESCLSPGPMRLWASHLASGIEVNQTNQPPTPGAIFQQPTKAQGVVQGLPPQWRDFGSEATFFKDQPATGAIFRQPSEAQRGAGSGDLSVLSAEQLMVEATQSSSPGKFCKGLGKESQRAKGQTFALQKRGGVQFSSRPRL